MLWLRARIFLCLGLWRRLFCFLCLGLGFLHCLLCLLGSSENVFLAHLKDLQVDLRRLCMNRVACNHLPLPDSLSSLPGSNAAYDQYLLPCCSLNISPHGNSRVIRASGNLKRISG